MTAARIPLNLFGMPLGLAGLGVSWLTMASYRRVPYPVGEALLLVPALARRQLLPRPAAALAPAVPAASQSGG